MSRPKQIDRIVALEGGLSKIEALLSQLVSNKAEEPTFVQAPSKKAATKVQEEDKFAKSAEMPLSYGQWKVLNIARWNAAAKMANPKDAELLRGLDTYKLPVVQKDAREAIAFAFVLKAAGKGATVAQHREMARLLVAFHNVGLSRVSK